MSKLTLKFYPDGDHVQRLDIEVETDAFVGRGWCWTDSTSLEEFSRKIAAYPLPEGASATFQMGGGQLEGDDLAGAIEIRQINLRGDLEVKAENADYHDSRCRVRVVFLTHYWELERFQAQIIGMISGAVETAMLEGA